jgi:hypothetical protein
MINKILGLLVVGLAALPVLAVAQAMTDDVASFSETIAHRNIFDPHRGPHGTTSSQPDIPSSTEADEIPGIQFVGTMSYEKGEFAFFQGTSAELSQVLQVGDKIAGYSVANITGNSVELKSSDSGEGLELSIGNGFRQSNDKWQFCSDGTLQETTSKRTSRQFVLMFTQHGTPAPELTGAPPTLEQNDVLKRLMQQREKENQ